MDLGIEGRTALVAAASKGLGKASALALASEGVRVAICARSADALEAAKGEIEAAAGGGVLAVPTDLSDAAAIQDLVARVEKDLGDIHILVNNAGGPPPGSFDQVADADWERAFELTLMSAVRLTRAVLPSMRRAQWGRIVNLASYSVKQPIADLMLSNSLRLSVIGWAKTLSNEVATDGILVNNVCTGWAMTDRVTQLLAARSAKEGRPAEEIAAGIAKHVPLGRIGKPEEIADLVAFLASERASYITGSSIQVDGGAVVYPL